MKHTIIGAILASTALTSAAFAEDTLTAVHAFPESLIYTKSLPRIRGQGERGR